MRTGSSGDGLLGAGIGASQADEEGVAAGSASLCSAWSPIATLDGTSKILNMAAANTPAANGATK